MSTKTVQLFEQFDDMAARKGPVIVINATDMPYGTRIGFTQDAFDLIYSDLFLKLASEQVDKARLLQNLLLAPERRVKGAGWVPFCLPQAGGHVVERLLFFLITNPGSISIMRESTFRAYED